MSRPLNSQPFVDERRHIEGWASRWLQRATALRAAQTTWANRGTVSAAQFPEGSSLWITDKQIGFVQTAGVWLYAFGVYVLTQADIAALVAALSANDAGLLLRVTDFKHTLFWSGAALDFAPGDHGSGYFVDAVAAPKGLLAGLCDGSAYTYLQGDGTTASYTTKNLTGHYRKSVTSGADSASAATTFKAAADAGGTDVLVEPANFTTLTYFVR